MTKSTKKSQTESAEETRTLGTPADPAIKTEKPQVADKGKIGQTIASIEDLSSRLAALDQASGPFGSLGQEKGSGLSGLLDDLPPRTAPAVSAGSLASDGDDETDLREVLVEEGNAAEANAAPDPVEEDDDLITSIIDDDAIANEPEDIFNEAPRDTDATASISWIEEESRGDQDFNDALDDILSEADDEGILDIIDETVDDPINDMLDIADAEADSEAAGRPLEEEGAHASPFKALFTPVDEDLTDEGVEDEESEAGHHRGDLDIEEYDPDEDLFFFGDEPADIDGGTGFTGALAGVGSPMDDDAEVINTSSPTEGGKGAVSDTFLEDDTSTDHGEKHTYDDADGASNLPQLTMGDDDDLYAPGTSYDEESYLEEEWDAEGTDLEEDERYVERESNMAKSTNGPEDRKDHDADLNTAFDASDLDDLLDEDQDDLDAAIDDYVGAETPEDAAEAPLILGEDEAVSMLFADGERGDDDPAGDQASLDEAESVDTSETTPHEAATQPPAKKKSRSLLVAAVSVIALAGAGGYAYMSGLIPGVTIPGVPNPAHPIQVADNGGLDRERNLEPVVPKEVPLQDLGQSIEPDLAAEEAAGEDNLDLAALLDDIEPNKGEAAPETGSTDGDIQLPDDPETPAFPAPGYGASLTDPEPSPAWMEPEDWIAPSVDLDMEDQPMESSDDDSDLANGDANEAGSTGAEQAQEPGEEMTPAGSAIADDTGSVEDPVVEGGLETSISEEDVIPVGDAAPEDEAEDFIPASDEVVETDAISGTDDEASMGSALPDEDITSPEEQPASEEAPGSDAIDTEEVEVTLDVTEEPLVQTPSPHPEEVEPAIGEEDPLAALAAEIDGLGDAKNIEEEAPIDNSVFVEEERFLGLEDTVTALEESFSAMTDEVSKLNKLILQNMERNGSLATRVEVTEQSLRSASAVLAEFAMVKESLDQTQVVLLDIAARVGTLETANPADREEVSAQIAEMQGEIKRITANMSILARMTVNGVSALSAEGASSGDTGVRTSIAGETGGGRDTVYSGGSQTISPPAMGEVPANASKGDFVEGYGYVLDVVPASGGQKLVVMENGSALVPN